MTKHNEAAEQNVTKGDNHGHDASSKLHDQLHNEMRNHSFKTASNDSHQPNMLDFSAQDPYKAITHGIQDAAKAVGHTVQDAGAAVAKGADQAWHDLDKDKNGHYFKHDICGDDPVKGVVMGTAVVGVGALAVATAAPEAVAAAGLSAFGTQVVGGLAALNGAAQLGWDALNKH
jgi:hypothetical protein